VLPDSFTSVSVYRNNYRTGRMKTAEGRMGARFSCT
jgi:hypothetical protein